MGACFRQCEAAVECAGLIDGLLLLRFFFSVTSCCLRHLLVCVTSFRVMAPVHGILHNNAARHGITIDLQRLPQSSALRTTPGDAVLLGR